MGTLSVDADGAASWGAEHPDWYVFPGALLPDGSGGWLKRPLCKWTREAVRGGDADAVRELWRKTVGAGKAVMCVAVHPSGIWVLDDDRDLPADSGWPELLAAQETLTLRSCTKARPHYVFAVGPEGERPAEGVWAGGEVKSNGIVFISDSPPIRGGVPREAGPELLEKLGGAMVRSGGAGGSGRGHTAVSSEELWEYFESFDAGTHLVLSGAGPEKFLDLILGRVRNDVDEKGDHRRMAVQRAVWAAAKEAAAGLYMPMTAYRELLELYQELRNRDGSWTAARMQDYDLMWAGAVAALRSGELDQELAENLERLGVSPMSPEEEQELRELFAGIESESALARERAEDSDLGTWENVSPNLGNKSAPEPPETGGAEDNSGGNAGTVPAGPAPVAAGDTEARAWEPAGVAGAAAGAAAAGSTTTAVLRRKSEPVWDVSSWDAPAGVPALASAPGDRPVMADDCPVWNTRHGKLARAMAAGGVEVSAEAVLAGLLTWGGAHLSGRGTHYISGMAHNPVVWSALVGRSAAARKTTGLVLVEGVYFGFPGEPAPIGGDPRLWAEWLPRNVSGFNSGEVLIDSFLPPEPVKAKGKKAGEEGDEDGEEPDPGYFNPRAVAAESELDRLWTAAGRDGSTLNVVLCNAWDGGTMAVRSRGAGVVEVPAGEYVLGLLGAATETRAASAVARNDGQMAYSGLANRTLWWLLPDETPDIALPSASAASGIPWAEVHEYREQLGLRDVRSTGIPVWGPEVGLTAGAETLLRSVYPWLKRGSKSAPGELGRECLGRAEAQVRRLALNFALTRGGRQVSELDLQNALAVWEYCRAGVRYLMAPERVLERDNFGGRYDQDARSGLHVLLADGEHPGWGLAAVLMDDLKVSRATFYRHIDKMVKEGLLVRGQARATGPGAGGRPAIVVASAARFAAGDLAHRAEGRGNRSGPELTNVEWE